jgi:hypothetical protein
MLMQTELESGPALPLVIQLVQANKCLHGAQELQHIVWDLSS